jgi:hypothetical protein
LAFAGAFWADSLVDSMSWLTVGAQFIRLQDSDFSEAANGVVLGAAVAAQVELDPDINAGMLNIAARKAKGKFHPYIGVGVGVARTTTTYLIRSMLEETFGISEPSRHPSVPKLNSKM